MTCYMKNILGIPEPYDFVYSENLILFQNCSSLMVYRKMVVIFRDFDDVLEHPSR